MKNKAIFLDRDGVLNRERGTYTYKIEDFEILPGVVEALRILKAKGYILIVITNQGGINKGKYTKEAVLACHHLLQEACGYLIDDIYYSPYHDNYTKSLSRKPNTLMLERAMAKYQVDVSQSWMLGDSDRDIIAGRSMGLKTALVVSQRVSQLQDVVKVGSLLEFVQSVLFG